MPGWLAMAASTSLVTDAVVASIDSLPSVDNGATAMMRGPLLTTAIVGGAGGAAGALGAANTLDEIVDTATASAMLRVEFNIRYSPFPCRYTA